MIAAETQAVLGKDGQGWAQRWHLLGESPRYSGENQDSVSGGGKPPGETQAPSVAFGAQTSLLK